MKWRKPAFETGTISSRTQQVKQGIAIRGIEPGSTLKTLGGSAVRLALQVGVILHPDTLDQVELCLDVVDMFFLIGQDPTEQVAADIIANGFAIRHRITQKRNRISLERQVAFENILDSLTSRERMGSTCIGDGVAIPHCKLPIDKPYGAIILLDEAVMCSTKDEPISVVFGFIIPEEQCQDHLPLLSEIASFCREGNWLQRIKSATSESQLRDILQSSDFNLAPYVNETSHS